MLKLICRSYPGVLLFPVQIQGADLEWLIVSRTHFVLNEGLITVINTDKVLKKPTTNIRKVHDQLKRVKDQQIAN